MAGKKGMRWARSIRDPDHLEEIRATIDAFSIVKTLKKHIFGEAEMSATQVAAAQILLRKVIPDVTATELTVSGHVDFTHNVEAIRSRLIPQLADTDENRTLEHADGSRDSDSRPRLELLGKTGTDRTS